MLERYKLQTTNRPINFLTYVKNSGDLLMDLPYQRGLVWGETRKRNLIRSILLGIPIPALIVNDRATAGWDLNTTCAVIDGKQRITAILDFFEDRLEVDGTWFGMEGWVKFSDLSDTHQRVISFFTIGVVEGKLGSIDEEIEVFELVNFGGVPQGECDEE